jgi:hypothetical protein
MREYGKTAGPEELASNAPTERRSRATGPTVAEGFRDPLSSVLPKGTVVGRYLLLESIGEGGMGQVYSAYDAELNRKLAIKLLQPRSDETRDEDRGRFMREGQAMARLSHPNVVAVHDVGSFGEAVFIAMDLVEGQTLEDWVEQARPSWREVTHVLLQAGHGLAAAHAAGVIHRDFKPRNILLGKDGRVCVTDFGIATAVGGPERAEPRIPKDLPLDRESSDMLSVPLTRYGHVVGTLAFMSPEQLRGQGIDARSDQFSYCVTFHEALYGESPFGGETVAERYDLIQGGVLRPVPPAAKVPDWLRKVLMRGLAAQADERFPSMEALLGEVARGRRLDGRGMLEAAARRLTQATRSLIRSQGTMRLARIRAAAALVFLGFTAFLGYGRGLADWQAYVMPLGVYFALSAVLAMGLRAKLMQTLHAYLGPIADCAAVCALQYRSLPLSPHPAGVAGWSLGLFVFLVTLSALSFRQSVIALTALAACVCEGFLQRVADVGWGAVVSSAIVLAMTAGTMAWILARVEVLIASRRS